MRKRDFMRSPLGLGEAVARLFPAAALALLVALTISASAADGRAVKTRVAPFYPEVARRLKIAGTVVIKATVEPEGRVSDVKTISGNSMLSAAAEDAVRRWKFAPASAVSTEDVSVSFSVAQ